MTPEQYAPLIGILVALPLILLRNRAPRRLRPELMWIMPAIMIGLVVFGMWGMQYAPEASHAPFGLSGWLIMAVALVLGGIAGWWRGKMMAIEKDADGTLRAQASPLGLILIVALLVSRQALRPWMESQAGSWHVSALALQDAFMLFIIGMIVLQRVEMFIRARRILAGGTDARLETTA
jgi:hypothetical protein